MFITLLEIPVPKWLSALLIELFNFLIKIFRFLGGNVNDFTGSIDSIPIYSFGFLILLCFIGSYALLAKYLEATGLTRKLAEDMVTWAGLGGVIGARVFSVISNPQSLMSDPVGTILSSAGFVFYGGLIGGMLSVYIVLRQQNLSFYRLSDIVAPTLALGYAIGRIGCQLSGDGDYGIETSLSWATSYKYGVVPTELFVHPTPVYESLFSVIILLLLTSKFLRNLLSKQGQLFGFYLILSGIVRFLVEYIRIEDRFFLDLSQAQFISIPLILVGLYMVFFPPNKPTAFLNPYLILNEKTK